MNRCMTDERSGKMARKEDQTIGPDLRQGGCDLKWIPFVGHSMSPTLKTGDLLYVDTSPGRKIRPGDIIVFRPQADVGLVAHRVFQVGSQCGYSTLADSNSLPDDWMVSEESILGRVILVRRNNRMLTPLGGRLGVMRQQALRLRRVVVHTLFNLLRAVFLSMARFRIFPMIARRLPTRVVWYSKAGGGGELHLFVGNRLVGRFAAGASRWQ